MANQSFRPLYVYYNNKKFGEVNKTKVSILPGDEAQLGSDGVLGYSDGITMLRVEVSGPVPTKDVSVPLIGNTLAKKYTTLGVLLGAKLVQSDMRCTGLEFDSDTKSGATTFSATFEGPEPEITG